MEKSKKFKVVEDYYKSGYWTSDMVLSAIDRWITKDEAKEILAKEL